MNTKSIGSSGGIQHNMEEQRHKCDEFRRILNIRWQQKIRNDEVMSRIGVTRDIVQKIMEKNLNIFGHICRMSDDRLLKQVAVGIMDRTNRRGR